MDRPSADILPQTWRLEDRVIDGCPLDEVQPEEWSAVRSHGRWRAMGKPLPGPGSLSEQDAWGLDALMVIEAETTLIDAAHAERARRRSAR